MKGGILSCGYDSALEGKSASRCLLLVICVTLALAIICILTKHRGKLGTYVWKSNLTAQNHRDEHFANLYLVVDSCVYVVFLSEEEERWKVSTILFLWVFFLSFWLLNCCCQDISTVPPKRLYLVPVSNWRRSIDIAVVLMW